jgi:pseudaminic acid synthase
MNDFISINGHCIGPSYPIYCIAEISGNHNQDFNQAVDLIHAAKEAGADAVKLQTYTADTLTIQSHLEYFRINEGTIWEGRTLYDLYKEASMPWKWQPRLKIIANGLGMDLFSTPFDATAVDFLEEMNVPAYKIASFELVDPQLIERVAQTGKPMILSTGMATLSEIDDAMRTAHNGGATQISLLKCNSAYPASASEMNLLTIPHLSKAFGVVTGLSDHTLGISVAVAAVALGASIIEKHLTLSRKIKGPDNAFSLEPHEFKNMVESVREAQQALGQVSYEISEHEKASKFFRRSLFVVKDMKAGEMFTEENIHSIRPAYGLSPKYLPEILGRQAVHDISKGEPLKWSLVK